MKNWQTIKNMQQLNSTVSITIPVTTVTQNIPTLSRGNTSHTASIKSLDKCYFIEENQDVILDVMTSSSVPGSSLKSVVKEEPFDDEMLDSHQLRETVLQHYQDAIESLKCDFRERLQELFFIQSGGNMVDYPAWKIRPNPHLLSFLNAFRLDESMSFSTPTATNTISPSIKMQSAFSNSNSPDNIPAMNLLFSEIIPNDVKLTNNDSIIKSEQHTPINLIYNDDYIKHEEIFINDQSIVPKDSSKLSNSQQSNSDMASEDIAGQVKHESDILDRVSQLRKNGLWSLSRLPKVYEQLRKKSHWDFLLEEMQWLAADFAQEKKWKRNMGRKISRAVLKYHQDQASQNRRAQNEEKARLRRIAAGIAKEVRIFWQQIEKVACYKQQSRQEEQRKKALDLHLNFIVDQTEKYSSWLVEGMKESTLSSPFSSKLSDNDEFEPDSDIDDDETTIAEEEENSHSEKYDDELETLRRESEMPIEDLINSIPEDILNKIGKKKRRESENGDSTSEVESDEYIVSEDEEDVEDTLDVEEKYNDTNHKEELEQLQKDSELPISELIKMYGNSNSIEDTSLIHSDQESDSNVENDDDDDDNDNNSNCSDVQSIKDEVPLSALIKDSISENKDSEKATTVPNKELNDAAATAESLQPKGFTLSTAQVKTSVPFLLKHSLREYQHIGLDWLVTMYSKQLNGILADEMGLGKTIQTIALLAHLACEEGCWGPHLIIVPTSVMLNWELELKKWCPGFKILTYFGTQKERKMKRAGWCKSNAFHVCITSYKLVIQDHQAFKRRKWKYIILDEAQNIKNFKSQRWQTLLNFNSQRRLLLTGTPLQNSLMELWSLMHFLMPNIFASHQDFKEWFSNPLTGMIEGSREYSEGIIKRLHTVLRPFLLRRLKSEVELQMPKKYEHVIMCRLSKRQRFLYDEFMGRTKTKETIAAGNFLSVINILMQLRKVCNHPDLFELRPTVSPFVMEAINYSTASLVDNIFIKDPLECIDISAWNFCFINLEMNLGAFQARRISELKVQKTLIEDITSTVTFPKEDVNASSVKHENICSNSSSVFKTLENISRLASPLDTETNRSYLDIMNFSQTTAGCASIGDILTRQLEESLDGYDVDIINVDNEQSSDIFYSPVTKKRKIAPVFNRKLLEDYVPDPSSPFFSEHLKYKADSMLANRLQSLAQFNEHHCSLYPLYGVDLRTKLNIVEPGKMFYPAKGIHCECEVLQHMVKSPKKRVKELQHVIERFGLFVHPVISSPIKLHVCHPAPSKVQNIKNLINDVTSSVGNRFSLLYPFKKMSLIQFPETRLVQYDCGKLQALNELLRRLKVGKHRVLIFTQMTKMLDVLERFLNYHGYIYLRLDGTTKVEQRQILMERFNQDDKIFIFILSTRSGGLGINLTGADTVVFYDSDWNPTMDAQAQDRCHRIGQTRDVHIYRLISERTVEENILKKAQQKRLLGNIAIEGGNFNTAYLKQESVQELFNTESVNIFGSVELTKKNDISSGDQITIDVPQPNNAYEQVLGTAEEEEDAVAAQQAKAEQELEMVEFSENVNNEINEKTSSALSKVEKDLLELESQLRPIELLALKFVESTEMYAVNDEVVETEKRLEQAKKDWELDHLRSIKEAEEQRNAEQEDEMLFTYVRDSTYSKEYIDDYTGSPMPMWVPPTPPEEEESEEVVDPCLCFLYETEPLPENHLPPTHFLKKNGVDIYAVKRNTSRTHYLGSFKKKRNRITKPRSIFDKKALELLSSKSKFKKSQKLKQKALAASSLPSSVVSRPDYSQRGPDWLINEDWVLLQTVNILSELPVDITSETIQSRSVNWELAADLVNCTSSLYRSSRQCRDRYQNVIIPREEGKLMVTNELNEQKLKKNKKLPPLVPLLKVPPLPQPQAKTYSQFTADNGKSVFGMHYNKFELIKKAALKRKPVIKQPTRSMQSFITNGVLSVEKPLNPKDLASMRAERIAKEKARALAAQQIQPNQSATSTSIQSQGSITLTTRTTQTSDVSNVGHLVKVTAVGIANNTGSIRGNLVFTSTALVGGSTLIVPTVSSANVLLNSTATSFATINCKVQNLNQNTVSIAQLTPASIGTTARILTSSQQTVSGISVSKVQAVATISSSIIAPTLVAQVQRGTAIATSVGTPALITTQPFIQGKALTQQQITLLRQKAAQQQQQQQQLLKIQQQQRLQQQNKQQLKLVQQQQPQVQVSKQPTVVPSGTQQDDSVSGSITVQTMKAPATIRGAVPQQIVTQTLTTAQQQQLLQQALKKQQLQQLQQRGQLASSSQIQQMLAGQKLTQQQLQQLQQQQRHTQLQQQLKFQPQQVTTTMVSQTKAQLVMTQVKQGGSPQALKTSGQQIQLHQLQQGAAVQSSLPQQILLRPTLTQASGQFQGLPQQIQLRAMINQQSNQQRIGQQLQTMQAQVNLQTGNVVMQSQQQPNNIVSQQLTVASPQQLIVASSLAQQQQLNIQAAVQKQVLQQQQQQQQQQQLKTVVATQAATSKAPQVQLQLQPGSHLSPQLQRQQVLSATPAQLSQVKAFVSQAQLQASQSRSNSPVSASPSPSTATSIQLQAQQVSQQMRRQAQLVQVQLKPPVVDSTKVSQQLSPKQVTVVEKHTPAETVLVEKEISDIKSVDAETTISEDKVDEHNLGMRTRTRSQHK